MLTVVLAGGPRLSSCTESQRGVAQSGSAPALGAGGPGFESRRPDCGRAKPRRPLWLAGFRLFRGGLSRLYQKS
jgi:hypothetical protein